VQVVASVDGIALNRLDEVMLDLMVKHFFFLFFAFFLFTCNQFFACQAMQGENKHEFERPVQAEKIQERFEKNLVGVKLCIDDRLAVCFMLQPESFCVGRQLCTNGFQWFSGPAT